ncbi:MAG: 23S rRNA (uracil(1939)-C(5))-methyltransferase RlmD [Succinivibrio sp.]|nr:23S rRNA (uracil(1939)-C(5))-methyltransferase RlmD [Succinivibrio sp.]
MKESQESISPEGTVTLKVERLSPKGEGIACFEDQEIYLQQVLPGEVVEAMLGEPFAEGSRRRPGEVVSFKRQSAERQLTPCPHLQHCGGCTLGLYRYSAQLELKAQDVRAILSELKLPPELFCRMVPSQAEQAWRCKSIRYVEQVAGSFRQGFYAARSHQLCPIAHCQAESHWMSEFALALEALLNAQSQELKAFLMRDLGPARLVVLISHSRPVSSFIRALAPLCQRFSLSSLQLLVHEGAENSLLSGSVELLYGSPRVITSLADLSFEVGAKTFLQVNPKVAEQMYEEAVSFCSEADAQGTALDLCCGIGTMSLMLARHFARVVGVEIVQEAVDAARANASLNGLDNLEFRAADLSAVLPELISEQVNAVICDPSRVGIGERNCQLLGKLGPGSRLCYIFCSLKAFRRDLPCLLRSGFEVLKIQGYDMFPDTRMQETVVFLCKK